MRARILIATSNPAKFEEAACVLECPGLNIVSLKDFPAIREVSETGSTFEENSRIKAEGYFEQAQIPTIADDGGLKVDYLNGAPGVSSKRWLGYGATPQDFAQAIVDALRGVPREKRQARLGSVITFWDGKSMLQEECWLEGYIAENIAGTVKPGFGYRAIFMISKFGKPYSDLTDAEHEEVNFRRQSLKRLKPKILELLAQKIGEVA